MAKFTGKTCAKVYFNFIKKRLRHRPCKFEKFLRTSFLKNTFKITFKNKRKPLTILAKNFHLQWSTKGNFCSLILSYDWQNWVENAASCYGHNTSESPLNSMESPSNQDTKKWNNMAIKTAKNLKKGKNCEKSFVLHISIPTK